MSILDAQLNVVQCYIGISLHIRLLMLLAPKTKLVESANNVDPDCGLL